MYSHPCFPCIYLLFCSTIRFAVINQGLAEDLELETVRMDWPAKKRADFFQNKYHWDILAANSVWSFGPDSSGPNILVDETLPHETDAQLLASIKDSLVQGFQWATREGPLCEEPIRNVSSKFYMLRVAAQAIQRSLFFFFCVVPLPLFFWIFSLPLFVPIFDFLFCKSCFCMILFPFPFSAAAVRFIPTARRVAASSFLLATPKLMEPVYAVEIEVCCCFFHFRILSPVFSLVLIALTFFCPSVQRLFVFSFCILYLLFWFSALLIALLHV